MFNSRRSCSIFIWPRVFSRDAKISLTMVYFGCTFNELPRRTHIPGLKRRQFLKTLQPASDPSALLQASSRPSRPQRICAFAIVAALLCSGATSCTKTQVGLSIAASAAIVAGVTVGITLAVQNSHHTLHGCAFTGPNGPELRTADSKVFALEGSPEAIKVGDRLKLHGSKLKKTKNSTGDQVFVVEKLKKDYGPCPAAAAATPAQ
jgi:hypothetical protein